MATLYTPNTTNNPTQVLLPDDGDPPVADSVNIPFKGIADKLFRMLDRIAGGSISGFVSWATGSTLDCANGSTVTFDAGCLELHANVPVFGDSSHLGTTTIGAAGTLDVAGHAIIRQSVALTSAGRIKGRPVFLAGTANVAKSAADGDVFFYEGLTADRDFQCSATGAEDGDPFTVSVISLGASANTVHVKDQAGNLLVDLRNNPGSYVWVDVVYSAHAPAGYRVARYGKQ